MLRLASGPTTSLPMNATYVTISVLKNATSESKKLSMPHWAGLSVRSRAIGGGTGRLLADSFMVVTKIWSVIRTANQDRQDASDPTAAVGCGRSATSSKLYDGGGDVVVHSSVQASQGSSPAGLPFR